MTTAQRASADRMMAGRGQSVTIVSVTGSTYDPATGTTTNATSTVTASAVLLPLDKARKVDGTTIVQGDETLLISALDSTGAAYAEPKVGGVVTLADGTSKRVIVAIDTLAPAGLAIMFDAVVRRVQ